MKYLAVLSIFLMFSLASFDVFAQTAEHIHKPHPHRHKQYAKIKNPVPMSEQSISEGKRLYEKHCSRCHGEAGIGDIAPDLTDDMWIHGNTDGEIYHVIVHGAKGTSMSGFKKELTKNMGWHIVNYIKSIKKEVEK